MIPSKRAGEYSWAAEFGKVTKPIGGSPRPDATAMGGIAAVESGAPNAFAATGKRIRRPPI
jgi:hypothetical protein